MIVLRSTNRGSPMPDRASAGVFDRALANLRSAWREIAGSARGVLSGAPRPDLPPDDAARLRQQMLSCLDGRGGEVTARARAAELGRTYLALNESGRGRFLRLLAEEFDTDHAVVDDCCALVAAACDAPASLLEKLMAYEAVHEIRGWTDLKNRLEADRRCFAFFHPRMPDEPLIFVEVALVSGIAGNIHALLDEAAPIGNPQAADTAIFYSISNCQRGLVGISFGDFLIKRVVDALTGELPRLKTFATLSPLPGFRAWLTAEA